MPQIKKEEREEIARKLLNEIEASNFPDIELKE